MKKVITKKLQADNDSVSSPEQTAPPTPSYENHAIMADTPSPGIYPPLPAQPPLPVDPPLPSATAEAHPPVIVPKREITDDQNDNSTNEDYEQLQLDNDILQNMKVEPNKIKEMCRDWARGTCTRENCRYSHVRDLKQLPRLYRFCHDYQNKGCVLAKCKFVHGTVHEQEVFIRTGVLPPHALAHIKNKANPSQPPLPPSDAPLPGPSGQHLVRNVMQNSNPMPSTSRARMDRPSTSGMNHAPMPSVAGPSGVVNSNARMPPVPPPNWTGEPICSTPDEGCRNCVGIEHRMDRLSHSGMNHAPMPNVAGPSGVVNSNGRVPTVPPPNWTGEPNSPPDEGCRNCVVIEHRVQHAKRYLANINKNLERSAQELVLLDQKEKRLMAVMNLWLQTCNNGVNNLGAKNNSNSNHNNQNQ